MLLRNLDIKAARKKWYDCHTCFVKLPLVSLATVLFCLYFLWFIY